MVSKNELLINSLRKIGTDPKATISENNERLRGEFRELTKNFLEPLECFLRLSDIGEKAAVGGVRVSAYQDEILRVERTFSSDRFLSYLSSKQARRDRRFSVSLYSKFIEGPNFASWLELEFNRVARERSTIIRTLISETDVEALLAISFSSGDEMAARVLQALNDEMAKPNCDMQLCAKMTEHLTALTAKRALND